MSSIFHPQTLQKIDNYSMIDFNQEEQMSELELDFWVRFVKMVLAWDEPEQVVVQ